MWEVVIKSRGMETVVKTGIRRENGARNERDIAADSAYRNALKHAEGDPNARVVRGSDANDENAEGIIYFETAYPYAFIDTVVTYRWVGPERRKVEGPDLTDVLLASLVAIGANPSL